MDGALKQLVSSGAIGAVLAFVLLMLFWIVKVLVTNSTENGKAMVKGVEDMARAMSKGMEELVTQSRVIRDNCLVCRQDSLASLRTAEANIVATIEHNVAFSHDRTFAEMERLVKESTQALDTALTRTANSIRATNEETLLKMETERLRQENAELSRPHNVGEAVPRPVRG